VTLVTFFNSGFIERKGRVVIVWQLLLEKKSGVGYDRVKPVNAGVWK
jgi:hypothetical protein